MRGSVFLTLAILVVAAVAVGFGLWIDTWWGRRKQPRRATLFGEGAAGAIFLFDGDMLVDSSPSARVILSQNLGQSGPRVRLMSFLAPDFPGLEERLADLPQTGALTLAAEGDRPLLLTAEHRGGLTRICLIDAERAEHMPAQDPMTYRAQVEELEQLRAVMTEAPVLIWRERADGAITWANAAYVLLLANFLDEGSDLVWPLPPLFERKEMGPNDSDRRTVRLQDGTEFWYDLQVRREGNDRLVFALPADKLEAAERALRDVLITLTKTFAHLHVGLAVFDKHRQLQLFNPAMTDLTGLPVDFLARRPSLTAVLDAMRERNMIPEPKDYRNWRRQLIEMEKAAVAGHYEETWSLPSGQTYRVIGRPHPDGALALIMEDISSEMTRSRRYRAEIELGLSVIDGLDDAVAVFSQAGQLVMSNSAYAQIWGHDPTSTLDEATVASLVHRWKEATAPSTIWTRFEELAVAASGRQAISVEARLNDGRLLACRFTPLAGGATMAAFRLLPGTGATRAAQDPERLMA